MNVKRQNLWTGIKSYDTPTPGRHQYYKVHHALAIPDEVRWQVRMCEHVAVSQPGLSYKDDVEKSILQFLKKRLNQDYMGGNRDLNLNLSVKESEFLFNASDKIKEMGASGELAALHAKCAELDDSVTGGYLKVMDALDRTLQQINETEDDIYDGLRDNNDLERVRLHSDAKYAFFDAVGLSAGNRSVENLTLAQGCDAAASEAEMLRQLVGARAAVMQAKAAVARDFATRVASDDVAADADMREMEKLRDDLIAAYGDDVSKVSGEGTIFKEQVDEISSGDLATLMDDVHAHEEAFNQRSEIYADYFSEETTLEVENFKVELLRHLAGSIIVKDHRNRYQRE